MTFTIKEDIFIRENLNTLNNTQIAEALGRNKASITNYLQRNGLKRTPEAARRMTLEPLKKGQGWNKGISHMSANSTSFKKGHKVYNETHDGAISVRVDSKSKIAYKYVRISKGKWDLLHRHLWKQQHGEIPKGHNIVFKDGDQMNCDLSNLELITRSENMRRNRNAKKAAETMKETWADTKIAHIYGLTPKGKWKNWKRKSKPKGQGFAKTESFIDSR